MIKLKLNICFSDTNMNRTVFAQWCWIWGANLAVVFELGPDLPGNVQAMAKVMPDIPTPERSKATPAVKKIAYKTARWGSCLFKNHHQRLWVGPEDTYVWPRLFCSVLKASKSWKQMISWNYLGVNHFYLWHDYESQETTIPWIPLRYSAMVSKPFTWQQQK